MSSAARVRKPDQIIQPWMFGEDAKKSTCWLKGLVAPTMVHFRGVAQVLCSLRAKQKKATHLYQPNTFRTKQGRHRWKEAVYQGIATALVNGRGQTRLCISTCPKDTALFAADICKAGWIAGKSARIIDYSIAQTPVGIITTTGCATRSFLILKCHHDRCFAQLTRIAQAATYQFFGSFTALVSLIRRTTSSDGASNSASSLASKCVFTLISSKGFLYSTTSPTSGVESPQFGFRTIQNHDQIIRIETVLAQTVYPTKLCFA